MLRLHRKPAAKKNLKAVAKITVLLPKTSILKTVNHRVMTTAVPFVWLVPHSWK